MRKDADRQRASNETSNAGGTPLDPRRIASERFGRYMLVGDAEGMACCLAGLPRTPEAIAYVRREAPELFAKAEAIVQDLNARHDDMERKLIAIFAARAGKQQEGGAPAARPGVAAAGCESSAPRLGAFDDLFRSPRAAPPVIGRILGAHANGGMRRPADCVTVGKFAVESGVVFVTDPWEEAEGVVSLDCVRNGIWLAHVLCARTPSGGRRVAELTCHAEGTTMHPDGKEWRPEGAFFLTSQCAGVFDAARYHDNSSIPGLAPAGGNPVWEPWYSACCDLTRDMAGVIPFGAVSSADGSSQHPYYTQTDGEGLVTAISIVFLDDSGEN